MPTGGYRLGVGRRAIITAGVVIVATFAAGCSLVVGRAVVRGGDTRLPEAAPGTYSIDYRCSATDGLMVADGTVGNVEDHDRRFYLQFVIVPDGGTTVLARRSFRVTVPASSTADFSYPLIDPSVPPGSITFDDETCVLVGVFEA